MKILNIIALSVFALSSNCFAWDRAECSNSNGSTMRIYDSSDKSASWMVNGNSNAKQYLLLGDQVTESFSGEQKIMEMKDLNGNVIGKSIAAQVSLSYTNSYGQEVTETSAVICRDIK